MSDENPMGQTRISADAACRKLPTEVRETEMIRMKQSHLAQL